MFNENQLQKIKVFSTLTKINNDCFKKCVHFDNIPDIKEENMSTELTIMERTCVKNCSISYLRMRDFIESQLFEDFETINKKNKNIFDNET